MSIFETIYPGKIRIGDTIGIAAPAGTFNLSRFSAGIDILENMGFKIFQPEELMSEDRWLAGDDATRVGVLHGLFKNSEVKAIVCARGGYGSMRLLDKIDFDIVRDNPKIFAGFSDITALLSSLYQKAGLVCYHAPVITSLTDVDEFTLKAFKDMLISDDGFSLAAGKGSGVVVSKGRGYGRLQGGNLATLNHLTGTEYMPDFNGAILMLEDIAEPPYKIDRMLTQMELAGLFNGLAGVGLGQFDDCGENEMILDIFKEQFSDKNIPVIAGFNFGHSKRNAPFPVGAEVVLDSNDMSVVAI